MGCFEAEAFSGAVIEAVGDESDVLVGDVVESHLLGEELADEPVHVFIGATLPGCVRMREVEIGSQFLGDRQVVGSDVTGNLLGTPCLGKLGVDKGPSFGGNATPILPGLLPTMCEFVRLLGALATLTAIPRHLPADGRFVTVHHSGNIASVMSGFGKDGNLVPFVLGDVCICHFRQL